MKNIFLLILALFYNISPSIAATKPLRLHLTYYPTVEFAGIFLAYERGWYKDAGIDLRIVFKDLNISENLNSDIVDVAMHSGHEVIRQVSIGHDVKAFAAEYQLNPLSLAAHPSIQTLKDLKGKTIGIFTDQEKNLLRVMLASEGMTLEQVKFKTIDSFAVDDLLRLLKTKEFDAMPVWAFNHPVGFALKGFNTRQFPGYLYGFHFYGTVFYAKSITIDERKTELAKFIEVTRHGWIEAYRDLNKTVNEHMKKWYPKDQLIDNNYASTLKQQLIQMKLSRRYLFEGVGESGFGEMTSIQWKASVKIAIRDGIIQNKSLTAEDVYTDEVMKLVRKNTK